jgi:hypothetical protein
VTADRGWRRPFDDPTPLPRGRQLVTLEDAGDYVTKLPKAVHAAAEWQAAMEALILGATLGGGVGRLPAAHASSACSQDRVNLHFFMDDDPAKGNAAIVTLGEMKNSERFRFVADGAEPLA